MVRKRSRGDDDSGKRSKRRTPGDPVVKQEPGGPNPAAGAAELGKDPSVKPEPGDARMGATPDWEELDSFGDPSPFPKWTRPLPEECELAVAVLAAQHGRPNRGDSPQRSVLDSLVRTMLSQNTTDKNSARAFASLKGAFPTWEEVKRAPAKAVEDSIRCGGLAETKAKRIQFLLNTLAEERGALCLEHLRKASNSHIKAELSRFPGVGPKTVACVLMFCLQRSEFPVDTHVWRLSRKMGWVPKNADRNSTYTHMNAVVPKHLKYDLHVLLINHGKACRDCAANGRPQRPSGLACPLKHFRTLGQLRKAAKGLAADIIHQSAALQQEMEDAVKHENAVKEEGAVKTEGAAVKQEGAAVKEEGAVNREAADVKEEGSLKAGGSLYVPAHVPDAPMSAQVTAWADALERACVDLTSEGSDDE